MKRNEKRKEKMNKIIELKSQPQRALVSKNKFVDI